MKGYRRCESAAVETAQLRGGGGRRAVFTLRFASAALAPAKGPVVGGFFQGERAHHRLTEKLGSADLLLPVLLQGQRRLLRLLLLPQFESWTTDHKQDEQTKGANTEGTKVIALTEEACNRWDLHLVLQL